ncbi:MAG: acyl-CoA dehydrogenase [archaeon]|nr:acyl-CoA dehydrogenase [archaeon]
MMFDHNTITIIDKDDSGKILYTKEEIEFKKEVQMFCENNVKPYEDEIQKKNLFPRNLIRELGKAGYMSVLHPPHIGVGNYCEKGLVYEVIIAQELSSICAGLDMARMASTTLFGKPISRFGTENQIQKFLKPIVQGEKIGALCITEPNVGSDVAGMETHAIKEGNDYLINGKKQFITNGSQADFLCVFAITDPSVHPKNGMTAFIVEKDMPGFEIIRDHDLMGMAGARVSELQFNEVHIPEDNILGKINEGFKICMDELDSERVAIAGESLGYAKPALEAAIKFAKERIQFQKPIRYFEGINFKIADMVMEFDAAELLVLKAARLYDKGMKITKEAAIAKLFASEMAINVCNEALQILGGRGYEKDNKIERYLRDARLMTIGGGTAEILRFLIQRETFKDFL